MNYFQRISFLILLTGSAIAGQAGAQVSTPESREEILQDAERFTAVDPVAASGAFSEALNPFYPESHYPTPPPEADVSAPTLAQAERGSQLPDLRQLAEQVRPTGVMQFGPQTMLLFGERRLGEGDVVPVQHMGTNYSVEIISVSKNSFTMRFNEEVLSKRIQ